MHNLPNILAVTNTPAHLLVFNPLQVLLTPFAGDIGDATRHDYFFEYFYRSALFGSSGYFELMDLARLLLVSSFTLIPFFVLGILRRHKKPESAFMLISFFLLLGAVFAYRISYPMSSNQHYRFVPLIIVPIAYFVTHGLLDGKQSTLREILGIVFLSLSAAFMFASPVFS